MRKIRATLQGQTGEERPHNSTYPKVAVQWLNQALCIYQSLCLVVSEVLLNRHLRVAAKPYLLIFIPAFDSKIGNFVMAMGFNKSFCKFNICN